MRYLNITNITFAVPVKEQTTICEQEKHIGKNMSGL
jgi:hypothetical protein